MSHRLQVQPLFVVDSQYQSCKIIIFLPISLSCYQKRIVCLNHKRETKIHGLLLTKVLPVRLHNPLMSFDLGMTITLSSSIILFYNLLILEKKNHSAMEMTCCKIPENATKKSSYTPSTSRRLSIYVGSFWFKIANIYNPKLVRGGMKITNLGLR